MNGLSWCPRCREWTVIDVGQPCDWCDTVLIEGEADEVAKLLAVIEGRA